MILKAPLVPTQSVRKRERRFYLSLKDFFHS